MDNNLPRTGIEQVFMRHQPNFIRVNKEFEPIYDGVSMSRMLAEDYKQKDGMRS